MYVYAVATKTISIDIAAYERLRKARVRPDESFSQVIKRARWNEGGVTGARMLEMLKTAPKASAGVLERLEQAQRDDRPPEDAWTG